MCDIKRSIEKTIGPQISNPRLRVVYQAQSDEDDLGGEDVAVSMEGSKLDEFFQEVTSSL